MTTQDFRRRMDLTGQEEVTGSEMNQLVDTAYTATDKGLRIVTTDTAADTPDVPDPNTELEGVTPTHWTNYKWVRKPFPGSGGTVKEYNWNDELTSDATMLKWQLGVDVSGMQEQIDEANANATLALDAASDAVTTATNANNTANTANATAASALERANTALIENDTQDLELAAMTQDISALQQALINDVNTIENGRTGATTVAGVRTNLGLTRVPFGAFIFKEVQATNTQGGTFTSGAQRKRTLNDSALTSGNINAYATLNGDSTFDLVAGVWEIEYSAPANKVGFHKASLYNVTDGVVADVGSSEFTESGAATVQTRSVGKTILNILGSKKFQINHICGATRAADGLGVASNLGGLTEVYTIVILRYLGSN